MSRAMADKQERTHEDMAIQSIMQVRAMYEDNVTVDSLTGKKNRKKQVAKDENGRKENRVVTKEEKKAELGSLKNKLGKAVKK